MRVAGWAKWAAVRFSAMAWLLVSLSLAAPVAAEPDELRKEAIRLGGEAIDLYDAGDYAAALEGFIAADELLPAPTLKFRAAECLEKLDRLQEAAEMFRQVIAHELTSKSPKVHHKARKEAVPRLAALLEEMPGVTVVVQGPGADDAVVTMGGEPFAADRLGQKESVDPGAYSFVAVSGDRSARQDVTLDRGDELDVILELTSTGGRGGDQDDGPPWPILGWTAIGLGGAGLVLGGVAGVVLLGQEPDLEERCPDRQCPPDAQDDVDSFDTMRILSTAGFIIGGVGLVAGTTFLLLAPSDEPEADEAQVVPYVTLGGLGIRGTF